MRYHSDMNSESQPLPAAIADRLKGVPDEVVNEIAIWRDRALRAEGKAENLEGRLAALRVEMLRAHAVIGHYEVYARDTQDRAEAALRRGLSLPYPDDDGSF